MIKFEGERFANTRWSMVLAAGRRDRPEAADALESLCRLYWYPLYAFIRRRGHSHHQAQDLTQEFLSGFVGSSALESVSPNKGRFRSYLLASLKNFLANDWDKTRRVKRGSGKPLLSWEEMKIEEHAGAEAWDEVEPERLLDREWARTVVRESLAKVRAEYSRGGPPSRFAVLSRFLPGGSEPLTYAAAAAELGVSEAAVKSAIHRLRCRFAEVFRAEVEETVCDPAEVEDEIRHLFRALVD